MHGHRGGGAFERADRSKILMEREINGSLCKPIAGTFLISIRCRKDGPRGVGPRAVMVFQSIASEVVHHLPRPDKIPTGGEMQRKSGTQVVRMRPIPPA